MSSGGTEESFLSITTPFTKDDKVQLRSFHGREAMSELFHFHLELVADKFGLDASKIVGKDVTFTARLPDDKQRFFHGIVSRFVAGAADTAEVERQVYRAEVVPSLWLLTLAADCRIFQNKSIPDILEQLCKDRKISSYEFKLKGKYKALEYCVQYRETDFHFMSRLMEKVGIGYYFLHDDGDHTLVFADRPSGFVDCAESEVKAIEAFGAASAGAITSWEHQIAFTTGKYAQTDYNFESPDTKLITKEKTLVKLKGVTDYEIYDYPGGYMKTTHGVPITQTRMVEREVGHEVVSGESRCPSFHPGGKFKLVAHTVKAEVNQKYSLISVEHFAKDPNLYFLEFSDEVETPEKWDEYKNTFQCIPAKTVFAPERVTPLPFIRGPHTAVVVGAKNQEIMTDKYGRVKVQFHWDRLGKNDDKSSCWIRVAQPWAGQKWGFQFIPRVGDEVMVDFLEGDPDRPIIVGSVYNANNMPPFKLPDNQTQSGIKTYSTEKGDNKTFNELRFEDKKDKEEIYFHAQRDFVRVVENDDKLKVGYDKKDKGDQIIEIYNDRKATIEKGNDIVTVKTKDRKITVEKGDQILHVKTGAHKIDVDKGDQLITVGKGDHKLKVSTGKSLIDAKSEILLKVGANSIKIDMKGVTIKGTMIDIQGTAKADLKSPMTGVTGDGMMKVKGGVVMIN